MDIFFILVPPGLGLGLHHLVLQGMRQVEGEGGGTVDIKRLGRLDRRNAEEHGSNEQSGEKPTGPHSFWRKRVWTRSKPIGRKRMVADEVQQYIWARTDAVQQLSPEVYRRKVILLGQYNCNA
jgi:hypothetical protein